MMTMRRSTKRDGFCNPRDDDVGAGRCECKELRDWISFGLLIFELNLIVFVDYLEASSGNAIKELKKMSAPARMERANLARCRLNSSPEISSGS